MWTLGVVVLSFLIAEKKKEKDKTSWSWKSSVAWGPASCKQNIAKCIENTSHDTFRAAYPQSITQVHV